MLMKNTNKIQQLSSNSRTLHSGGTLCRMQKKTSDTALILDN